MGRGGGSQVSNACWQVDYIARKMLLIIAADKGWSPKNGRKWLFKSKISKQKEVLHSPPPPPNPPLSLPNLTARTQFLLKLQLCDLRCFIRNSPGPTSFLTTEQWRCRPRPVNCWQDHLKFLWYNVLVTLWRKYLKSHWSVYWYEKFSGRLILFPMTCKIGVNSTTCKYLFIVPP